MDVALPFPIVRVTLLGAVASGKTQLIESIVNNSEEDAALVPTLESTFYYRQLTVDGQRVMLELEDTPGSQVLNTVNGWRGLSEEVKLGAPVCRYISLGLPETFSVPAYTNPAEIAPLTLFRYSNHCKPITPNRMAYMVVFDLSQEASCNEAEEILELLRLRKRREQAGTTQLIVFLVGSHRQQAKPELETHMSDLAGAGALPFFAVDAVSGSGVIKLFKQLT